MSRIARWTIAVALLLHGLIHVLGAAKGLGWADVNALRHPIGPATGVAWLVAGILVVAAAVLLLTVPRLGWAVALGAAAASQAVIVTSWSDARAGTVANVVLVLAAVHALYAHGPLSADAEYRRLTAAELSRPTDQHVVTETDLAHLPPPVATYMRRSGAVGAVRPSSVRATIHGRIRATPTAPWMTFTGEQVNRFGPEPSRLFLMHAERSGMPVDVLHAYLGEHATMRAKALSMVTVARDAGPEMDQAETVTLLNDMCVLAPATLTGPALTWQPVDERRAAVTFTNNGHTVGAELRFDEAGDLVDFVSQDRFRSADGKTHARLPWSTPLARYGDIDGHRRAAYGDGVWHAPEPEGTFSYIEFHVDALDYDAPGQDDRSQPSG